MQHMLRSDQSVLPGHLVRFGSRLCADGAKLKAMVKPVPGRSHGDGARKKHCVQGLDFFGGMPVAHEDLGATLEWEAQREEDRIVVLSDLWLDRPETLDRLHVVMSGGLSQVLRVPTCDKDASHASKDLYVRQHIRHRTS